MKVRLGTRGSVLARAQAEEVARGMGKLGVVAELVVVQTAGDRHKDERFSAIGPHGVFVAEIERALLAGRIDAAVHSCKDLPSKSARELTIAAIPERLAAEDVLLVRQPAHDPTAGELPVADGARVGTASARRRVLVRALRPDLNVLHLRGNVPTRIRRLLEGDYDAILLAAAGLERLRQAGPDEVPPLDNVVETVLDPEVFIPAPAQGAVAIQIRRSDFELREVLRRLDDAIAHRTVAAERELLAMVDAGCDVPFGAWCRVEGQDLTMTAVLERNGRLLRARGRDEDGRRLASGLWRQFNGEGTPT